MSHRMLPAVAWAPAAAAALYIMSSAAPWSLPAGCASASAGWSTSGKVNLLQHGFDHT